MLMFNQTAQNSDGTAEVHVFIDEEKGHTVYLSKAGQLCVIEAEKKLSSKTRAAGFAIGSSSSCSDCDGC